jgi:hypothetical protein
MINSSRKGLARALAGSLGVFLLVGAVYAAAGPGRIDIIDGQYRFDVAKNIVEDGSIQLTDPFLGYGVPGVNGPRIYSPYSISGSLMSLPLIGLASIAGTPSRDRQQFFFSFTSAVLGAATAAVLFLFYLALGVQARPALLWTLAASFATISFPAATTVFDQTQHGFFVLCACLLAFLSARRESMRLAVAGGVCLAVLVNYQESYAILFVPLAIAALGPTGTDAAARRRSLERGLVFIFIGCLGLLVWASINDYRFGSFLLSGKTETAHPPAFDNPLLGLAGLLVSPGKSIFLYSPLTAAALYGSCRLLRREPQLGRAVLATSAVYLALISTLSFYGGDWCWGPRYFATILPLLALGLPFIRVTSRSGRLAVRTTVAAGVIVQLLALSIDHHRFFYSRSLPIFFWYRNSDFYFTHSALFSRPGEIVESLRNGVPAEAESFRPGPNSGLPTYAVFGGWGHGELPAPLWMRRYKVFWLPRPWPLWLRAIPPDERPINLAAGEGLVAALAAAGALTLRLAGTGQADT